MTMMTMMILLSTAVVMRRGKRITAKLHCDCNKLETVQNKHGSTSNGLDNIVHRETMCSTQQLHGSGALRHLPPTRNCLSAAPSLQLE